MGVDLCHWMSKDGADRGQFRFARFPGAPRPVSTAWESAVQRHAFDDVGQPKTTGDNYALAITGGIVDHVIIAG